MSNILQRHKLEFYKNLLIKVNQLIEGKIKMLESSKVTKEDVQVDWKNIRNKPTFIPDNKEGALHWYEVRLLYRRKGDMNPTFNFQTQIGLTNQKDILNARILKKTFPPLHKSIKATNQFLNNGILYTELICYLGHFSNE